MKVINRIKDNNQFAVIVKKGETIKSTPYLIHFLSNDQQNVRVGISVSKKIGNAVIRNRTKRQIRAMCDSLINYSSHTFDIVIVVRKEFLSDSFEINKNTLNDLLSKIGITKWKKEQKLAFPLPQQF